MIEFIDDLVNLAIIMVFFVIITAIVFGVIFTVGGAMMFDGKEDDSKSIKVFVGTIIVLFLITNVIGLIVGVKGLFFD